MITKFFVLVFIAQVSSQCLGPCNPPPSECPAGYTCLGEMCCTSSPTTTITPPPPTTKNSTTITPKPSTCVDIASNCATNANLCTDGNYAVI
ncbi:hypothetical protein FO519_002258 [Halicephalobus sp. NKZ332]|nr:hypothetical protein FO519_002258 [Halicephalobus sp. NKZ332]